MAGLLSLLEMERLRCPDASDEECVRAVAADLVDQLGVTEPPVNVEMVASMLDVAEVHLDWELDVAGCLICKGSTAEIRVRGTDTPVRQRFTVCHECAHIFFPGYQLVPRYRCDPGDIRVDEVRLERLCDVGASELLLPRRLFGPAAKDAGFGLDGLESLAQAFNSSLPATGRRLIDTVGVPAALLSFEPGHSVRDRKIGAPPKLRLQYAITTGTWPYFRKNKSVEVNSAFDRAQEGESVQQERSTISGLCAADVEVVVDARLFPYTKPGVGRVPRVLALVRRAIAA
jgi:hypothetical protein